MKRITTQQPQSRLEKTVQVELTLGELAQLYIAVGAMSTAEYKRRLSLPSDDLDGVSFAGINNAELTQYIDTINLFDDLEWILSEEGVNVE